MASGDETIRSLREALKHSPDNLPLRKHLAETLIGLERFQDAEQEYRDALRKFSDDPELKLGLAVCFYKQSKTSEAMVVVEDLVKGVNVPGKAYVLYARLLLGAGEVSRAVAVYKQGIKEDPSAKDDELAATLGITDDEAWDVVDGRMRASWEGGSYDANVPVEKPKCSFADVGGMEELKDEIRMKIILPLQHPEMYKAYGKTVGGGILMYGPPGCGKTHLARATAGEIEAGFFAVGINDVLDMWIGRSEQNLHALFEQARASTPFVLFFDEVDALGASRADMRHSGGKHLINQFLAELDGVQASNDGVLILAATNAPWHLDNAFRRPGRFDRILFVPPPDGPARAEILRILCKDKPTEGIDHHHLAKRCDGFSGADLKAVIDLAVEAKLRVAMKEGVPKPLTTADLRAAMNAVKPSTREWFATAKNYALYSNQGGVYDDILKFLKIR